MAETLENMQHEQETGDDGIQIPIEGVDSEAEEEAETETARTEGEAVDIETGAETENEAESEEAGEEECDSDLSSEETVTDEKDFDEKDSDASASEEKTPDGKAPDKNSKSERGGFFKKKKDKRDEQIAELGDKLKRQIAEFDNFRKRSEREKSQMFDMGARTVIEKLLPVADNFERGLAGVPEEQREDAFVSGMDMIYKQLMTEFENLGVKPIECVGQEFNPEYHNAVMQVESEEYESGIVAQELQKGYTYKDYVVRHSMVAVVQ